MANTTIALKKSATPGNIPSSLANGEIALNFADGKLFYRAANGTITSISGSGGGSSTNSFATINANSSLILATSATDTLSIVPGNGISIATNTTSKTITINSTANANVFSSNTVNTLSLLANTANISTLNVINHVVTGNSNVASLSATNIFANNYYYANGTPLSAGGGGGGGNVSASGWTANSVITANSTGYLSSPANLQFFTSNNTLVVTGNVVGGGVRTTSAATPPASPTTGDLWYNTSTDVMYRWTFDGTNYYWIDNVSSATASNGSLLQANVTYNSVTANTINVSTIYANTLNVIENNVTFTGNISSNSITSTSVYANSYYFANGSILTTGSNVPKITGLVVTNSSYIANGWTAVSNTGGYMLVNGSGFVAGATVLIGSKTASSTGFVSANQLQVQVPAQADGTYPVYVTNPDGGVAINVPGLTYNDLPVWSTGSTLPNGVSNSAISIQLSATDTTTVTYSLASGSTLPTGLTLSSSGLLSGTVSTSILTVYTFAVNAVDIYSQNTSQTFSITIVIGDTYFPYTSLLLSASTSSANTTGTSNANTVIDSSYNYNSITRAGNPGQGTFNPFGTNWSNYFDGSTGGLTSSVNPTQLNVGSNNFTIEFWFYATSLSSTTYVMTVGPGQSGSLNRGYSVALNNGASPAYIQFDALISGSGQTYVTTFGLTSSITLNTWHHIAFVRSGANLYCWLDGVQSGSTSNITTGSMVAINSTDVLGIGAGTGGTGPNLGGPSRFWFPGYLSNLRILNGTALYTSAFTPPTAPLSVVANTVLLTCQSNTFKDANTTPLTITPNTTSSIVTVQRFNPFGVNQVPYNTSANTYIGSTYFNGSTDYLSFSPGNNTKFGTNNFTVECWLNLGATQNASYVIDARDGSNTGAWAFGFIVSAGRFCWYNGSAATAQDPSTTDFSIGTWVHVAYVRNGTTGTLYVNGLSVSTASDTTNYTVSGVTNRIGGIYSGVGSPNSFNGYISNLRIINGTALYTSNFIPPTGPLSVVANTVLLTCQSSQTVTYDANTTPSSITTGGTPRPTKNIPFSQSFAAQFPFGTGYLSIPNNSQFYFGTNPFTIEFWYYPVTPYASQNGPGIGQKLNDSYGGWVIYRNTINNSSGISIRISPQGGGTTDYYGPPTIVSNTWQHHAIVRDSSNNLRWYLNGALSNTYTGVTVNITDTNTTAGMFVGYAQSWPYITGTCYISNLRILNGTALYTGNNFTISNTPLTAIANTVLLTCQSGSTSNTFIDNSTNGFTITNVGTPGANVVSMAAPGYSPMPIVDTSTAATTYGGSYYFNGSTDHLTVPVNPSFGFGTGNFTWEAWIFPFQTSSNQIIYDNSASGDGTATGRFLIDINSGSLRLVTNAGTTILLSSTSSGIVANTWQHIAISRSGTTGYMFINGAQATSGTVTTNFLSVTSSGTNRPIIGVNGYDTSGSRYFGYISNLRVVNGTALYTSAFTPPTAPFNPSANIAYSGPSNTALLLSGTNVGAYDSTMINDFINVGGVSVNSNVKQYGTNSYYFNGSNYLQLPISQNYILTANSNFTVEFWFNATALNTYNMILGSDNGASSDYLAIRSASVELAVASTSSANFPNWSYSFSTGTWYHVAVTRSSGSLKAFINGTQLTLSSGSASETRQWFISNVALFVGKYGNSSNPYYYTGYLQDLRVTLGTARYTSNFTVPSTPFITQ